LCPPAEAFAAILGKDKMFEVRISKCSLTENPECQTDEGLQALFFRDKQFSIYVTSNSLISSDLTIVPFTKLTHQFSLSALQLPQDTWVTLQEHKVQKLSGTGLITQGSLIEEKTFYQVNEVKGWGGAVNLPTYKS
jgi:hypothetical protein